MELRIAPSKIHGDGLFAERDFKVKERILYCPVLILDEQENEIINQTSLASYTNFRFTLSNDDKSIDLCTAIPFGPIAYINHEDVDPNADWEISYDNSWIILKAIRPIMKGEEITIGYDLNFMLDVNLIEEEEDINEELEDEIEEWSEDTE